MEAIFFKKDAFTFKLNIRFDNGQLQVDEFQKVSFVYHFIKEFERKFYIAALYALLCKISFQIL